MRGQSFEYVIKMLSYLAASSAIGCLSSLCVHIYVWAHIHICGGLRSMSGVFLNWFPFYFFERGGPTEPGAYRLGFTAWVVNSRI